jgi:hypothetical protein
LNIENFIVTLSPLQDIWFLPNAGTYAVKNYDRRFLASLLDLLSLRENLVEQQSHQEELATITTVMDSLINESCQYVGRRELANTT